MKEQLLEQIRSSLKAFDKGATKGNVPVTMVDSVSDVSMHSRDQRITESVRAGSKAAQEVLGIQPRRTGGPSSFMTEFTSSFND